VTYAHRETTWLLLCRDVIAGVHILNSVLEKYWFHLGITGIHHRVVKISSRKTEHQMKQCSVKGTFPLIINGKVLIFYHQLTLPWL